MNQVAEIQYLSLVANTSIHDKFGEVANFLTIYRIALEILLPQLTSRLVKLMKQLIVY